MKQLKNVFLSSLLLCNFAVVFHAANYAEICACCCGTDAQQYSSQLNIASVFSELINFSYVDCIEYCWDEEVGCELGEVCDHHLECWAPYDETWIQQGENDCDDIEHTVACCYWDGDIPHCDAFYPCPTLDK